MQIDGRYEYGAWEVGFMSCSRRLYALISDCSPLGSSLIRFDSFCFFVFKLTLGELLRCRYLCIGVWVYSLDWAHVGIASAVCCIWFEV